MKTQSKKEKKIVEGSYNIAWISSIFKEHFGDVKVSKSETVLKHKVLPRYMNDKEILAELKPNETTLGELANALETNSNLLKNGYANIFYIRDIDNSLWAVLVRWFSVGWSVCAISVGDPLEWNAGSQVLSRDFGSKELTSNSSDSLILGYLEEIEELVEKIKSKI